MLDPVQLRTLAAVLEHRSFAAAATALRYTPSAVSQQMAALERSCGAALFERMPHRIAPTAAALELGARSADILTELAAAERAAGAVGRGETGNLRIGAFPTAGARLIPAAVKAFSAGRPGAGVELDEAEPDQLTAAVISGELDVALVYRYDLVPVAVDARLSTVALLREAVRLLVASDHPLAARPSGTTSRPTSVSAVRGERWVAPLVGSPGALNLDRLCAADGFRAMVAFRSNDYSVVRGLVAAGLGVALVPDLALVEDPQLRALGLAGRLQSSGRAVAAVHRRSNRNPLLAPMLEALSDAAAHASAQFANGPMHW